MPDILLLNPNTHRATTAMMVQLLQAQLPTGWRVQGHTASAGAPLITTASALALAAEQVLPCWAQAAARQPWDGVVLACFADPALHALRQISGVPTIGIGEAALRAASQAGQRFGIATTTPDLDAAMHAQVKSLGLQAQYTGARYTESLPSQLTEAALHQQLLHAVQQCVAHDGAQQVVIGGGPLGQAALALASHTATPLVAPLTAAAQWLQQALRPHRP